MFWSSDSFHETPEGGNVLVRDSFAKPPRGEMSWPATVSRNTPRGNNVKRTRTTPTPPTVRRTKKNGNLKMKMSVAWVLASVPVFTSQLCFLIISFL